MFLARTTSATGTGTETLLLDPCKHHPPVQAQRSPATNRHPSHRRGSLAAKCARLGRTRDFKPLKGNLPAEGTLTNPYCLRLTTLYPDTHPEHHPPALHACEPPSDRHPRRFQPRT